MAVSYKKLWKLLIDRDLKKKDLEAMAQVSHYTMNKLTHGDNVTTDVLGRICKALGCSLDDLWSSWMSKQIPFEQIGLNDTMRMEHIVQEVL